MEERYLSGAYFKYADSNLIEKKFSFSNLHELGIDRFESTATGNVRVTPLSKETCRGGGTVPVCKECHIYLHKPNK